MVTPIPRRPSAAVVRFCEAAFRARIAQCVLGALALAASLLACAGEESAKTIDSTATAAALVIEPPPGSYRETTLGAIGRIRGRVLADVVHDVAVAPPAARDGEPGCSDAAARVGPPGIDGGLPGAVVWLRDARQGKALPLARRYTLTNRGCRLEPRVQATVAGGTLNIRNLDPLEHRTRLVRQGSVDIVSVVRQYDEGQVVPDEEVLERPALVHATCELHPWSEAWVAVFDHPYFAVTTPDGAFVIDSVPPGTYRLVVWHEREGKVEREVTVGRGESVLEVKLD